jgi:fructose-1,6-bisphosphatase/inositol monophosphatase family enzyme
MKLAPSDADVIDVTHRVAREELLPRFERIDSLGIRDKGGGELVTDADEASEEALAAALTRLLPGSVVIGEEGADRDPSVLAGASELESVWLVDPLDGTHHFAEGRPAWGVMVSLLRRGEVQRAWIHLPLLDRTAWGSTDQGVFLNGTEVRWAAPPAVDHLCGVVGTKFLPEAMRRTVEANVLQLDWTDARHGCAAEQYTGLLNGDHHFALYNRTSPWDHAAGAFLVERCGGVARRFDGSRYMPTDGRSGLLVAASETVWSDVRAALLPAER